MFSSLRPHTAAHSSQPGDIANEQARHIASLFPGRMTGTPAAMLSANYLQQQFAQMAYKTDIHKFKTRYSYNTKDNQLSWQNVTDSSVIAAHEGRVPQQIIIMTHLILAPRAATPMWITTLVIQRCRELMIMPPHLA